ncbi:thioredoxin-disulfide reductase [Candidatus Berkelbacteria bacterium]|nr:thioredoxin-disulfide reductase [Candidatus Berkelbacteria bacterium]
MSVWNVIIIGSGPAGLTAALYAARAELKPLVLGGVEAGGQLMLTTAVENFPGFESIQGPELMQKLTAHAQKFGAEVIRKNATRIDFGARPFKIWSGEESYQAKSVIIATGASAQWLGLESETRLRGHGVSSCATCDGFFFKGKRVIVVGGGDTALEDATFLTKFATQVTIVHRRDVLRASKPLQRRAEQNDAISFKWNRQVVEVLGEDRVTGVRLRDTTSGEEETIETDGLFVAIGHKPNTELFAGRIELDAKGYIVATHAGTHHTTTNVDGVFVAGDVEDARYRQAITAAGAGCKAAMDAERWLAERGEVERRTMLYGQ